MAGVTQKSKLMAKYAGRAQKAAQAHAADPTDYGNMRVPPGITNGTARLTRISEGEYKTGPNKGKLFWMFEGSIVTPKSVIVNGQEVPCEGLFTRVTIPADDTVDGNGKPVPVEEHIANIQNEMRKLLASSGMSDAEIATFVADVDGCRDYLNKHKPPFRFSTSVRKAREYFDKAAKKMVMGEEGVWENWFGSKGLENWRPPTETDVVENGQPSANGAVGDVDAGDQVDEGSGDQADVDEGLSPDLTLAQLAEIADGPASAEADQAQDALTVKALEAGVDEGEADAEGNYPENSVKGAPSWTALVEMIEAAGTSPEPEPEAEPEPEPWLPEKGKVCKYQQTDAKGKPLTNPKTKRKLPPLEVEVVTVDKKRELCTVKDTSTKKPVVGADKKPLPIAFADLEPAD